MIPHNTDSDYTVYQKTSMLLFFSVTQSKPDKFNYFCCALTRQKLLNLAWLVMLVQFVLWRSVCLKHIA